MTPTFMRLYEGLNADDLLVRAVLIRDILLFLLSSKVN